MKMSTTAGKWATVCLPYEYMLPEGAHFYQVAGLLSDYSALCLEEVSEVQHGYPYIFITDENELTFYTYGEKLVRPVTRGTNNLVGNFASFAKVPAGGYILADDGEWYRIGTDRPNFELFTVALRKAEGLPLFEVWTSGPTMPIHGVVDELGEPDAVNSLTHDGHSATYYRMDGRRTNSKPVGLHIKQDASGSRKIIGK